MSAFVVEDNTINRVVSWINEIGMAGRSHDKSHLIRRLSQMGYHLDTDLGCKRLAEEMFTLNCDSIEQRYGEGQAKEFRPLDFAFEYQSPPRRGTIYQILKSLRCFLYQCCEGNIPEQNALYVALDRLSLEIAFDIVSRLPVYDAVEWD